MKKLTDAERVERFWSCVNKTYGCWEWVASRFRHSGYGRFNPPCDGHGKRRGSHHAHVFSWVLHFGPVPLGLCVLHKCDNPPCVRPEHLFLGTRTDNNKDRDTKGRTSHSTGSSGELNSQAKLTLCQVVSIRKRKARGESASALSARFGISIGHLYDIVSYKVWKHA